MSRFSQAFERSLSYMTDAEAVILMDTIEEFENRLERNPGDDDAAQALFLMGTCIGSQGGRA